MHQVSKSNIDFTVEEKHIAMLCVAHVFNELQFMFDDRIIPDGIKSMPYTELHNQILIDALKFTLRSKAYSSLFAMTSLALHDKVLDIKALARKLMALEIDPDLETSIDDVVDFEIILKDVLQKLKSQGHVSDKELNDVREDMGWRVVKKKETV